MKDKLYKTGHKKAYYRFRNLGFGALFFSLFALIFATPLVVSYAVSVTEIKATHESKIEEKEPVQEELILTLE